MTVAIAFAGGTYGTYLEWCLDALTSNKDLVSPFTSQGNSHKYLGTHLLNMTGWQRFLQTNSKAKFVRLHPKITEQESLDLNLEQLCNQAQHVIHLYPSEDTTILSLNNFFSKIWDDWWQQQFKSSIDVEKIYLNWPVAPGTAVADICPWIKREFLSFYLMPAWRAMLEWHHPTAWSHPKCLVVTVGDLLHDFENTLARIQTTVGLTFQRSVADIVPYHQENLKLQKFLSHDQLCREIVKSVCGGSEMSWEPLGLCSESWIQWELRNQGFEIRCHGLDTLPTNSLQLKELLYSV